MIKQRAPRLKYPRKDLSSKTTPWGCPYAQGSSQQQIASRRRSQLLQQHAEDVLFERYTHVSLHKFFSFQIDVKKHGIPHPHIHIVRSSQEVEGSQMDLVPSSTAQPPYRTSVQEANHSAIARHQHARARPALLAEKDPSTQTVRPTRGTMPLKRYVKTLPNKLVKQRNQHMEIARRRTSRTTLPAASNSCVKLHTENKWNL